MGTLLTQTHTATHKCPHTHTRSARHTGAYNLCLRRNGINIYRPWKCQLLWNKEPIYLWIWHSWRLAAIFCFSKCVFGGCNGGGGGGARMEIKVWPGWPGAQRGVLDLLHCYFNPHQRTKKKEIQVPQDRMCAIKEWCRAIKISQMWTIHSSALSDWLTLSSVCFQCSPADFNTCVLHTHAHLL